MANVLHCGILDEYFYENGSEQVIEEEIKTLAEKSEVDFILHLRSQFSKKVLEICRELYKQGKIKSISVVIDYVEIKKHPVEKRKQLLEQYKDEQLLLLNTQGMNDREKLFRANRVVAERSRQIIGYFSVDENHYAELISYPIYDITCGKHFISIDEILE